MPPVGIERTNVDWGVRDHFCARLRHTSDTWNGPRSQGIRACDVVASLQTRISDIGKIGPVVRSKDNGNRCRGIGSSGMETQLKKGADPALNGRAATSASWYRAQLDRRVLSLTRAPNQPDGVVRGRTKEQSRLLKTGAEIAHRDKCWDRRHQGISGAGQCGLPIKVTRGRNSIPSPIGLNHWIRSKPNRNCAARFPVFVLAQLARSRWYRLDIAQGRRNIKMDYRG